MVFVFQFILLATVTSNVLLQLGVLRFFGPTEFASGTFAGVELDEPVGKNDGSYGGIRYFTCPAKHGKPLNIVTVLYIVTYCCRHICSSAQDQ